MAAPGFYNEQDQNIYDNVSKFMPQSKYLRSAPTFTAPTTEEEEITETFGIPNTNAFTNSGGDNYTGGYNFNNNGFQQAVDARQYNLNNPNKVGQFVNKGLDFIGIQPQRSYQDMIESRLTDERKTSGIPLGVGSMIAKALPDRYYDMSLADQAFIQSQMGYTGPTIFGENNSGLGKDEFGINTRSMFGNYAEYVDKKGKSDMTDEEFADYVAGLKGLPKRMALTYRQKSVLRNKIKQDTLDQQMAASAENRGEANAITNRLANEYKAQQQRDGRDFSVSGPDTSSNPTGKSNQASSERGYAMHGADGGRAGYFFGGRVNFKNGGLASIL